ncbi:MAG: hypothetical protein ACKPA9_16570, partial [Microcystis sp.]
FILSYKNLILENSHLTSCIELPLDQSNGILDELFQIIPPIKILLRIYSRTSRSLNHVTR